MKEIRDQSSALGKHFGGPGGCGSEAFFIQIIETDVKLDKLRKVEEDWQQDLGQANPRPASPAGDRGDQGEHRAGGQGGRGGGGGCRDG